MSARQNTQTPKMTKAEKEEAKKQMVLKAEADAKKTADEAAKAAAEGGSGGFPDPYAGRRWIPRWVSVPLQFAALAIIIYNRKTAIDERISEMQEEEEQQAEGDVALKGGAEFDYPETVDARQAIEKASMRLSSSSPRRTSNIKPNNGEFDKPWRHVFDTEAWKEDHSHASWLYSPYCTLEKRSADSLSREEFEATYLEKKPVVIVGATDTSAFTAAVQKAALLNKYGNHSVTLSSANKNSYAKQEAQLLFYVDEMMSKPQTLTALGNETWYHFGDNKHAEWEETFALYQKPSRYIFGKYASLSFGLGASGSGVPFHTHGHVFAEVFYGKKRWWISPPAQEPLFGPDETSISWLDEVYPFMMTHPESGMRKKGGSGTTVEDGSVDDATRQKLLEALEARVAQHTAAANEAKASGAGDGKGKAYTRDNGRKGYLLTDSRPFAPNPPNFYECTLEKGEMLYIPGLWWHSTLNMGETVFMSVFV